MSGWGEPLTRFACAEGARRVGELLARSARAGAERARCV